MLHYSEEELPNSAKSLETHIHPEDFPLMQLALKEHILNNKPYDIEYRLRNKEGEYGWYHVTGAGVRNKEGLVTRMVGSMVDITEMKGVEKMKNEFIAVVSHELRTPLTSIKGSLALVLSGTLGSFSEKSKKLLEIANNNCDRLLFLVNDILDLEKVKSGKIELTLKQCSINEIVEEAIANNQMYCDKYHVQIQLARTLPHTLVIVDKDRILQVLANLISNAAKFAYPNTIIQIEVLEKNDKVRVNVIDKGPGVPLAFRNKIFNKFEQADSSPSRVKGGTGLGLSISRAIIELHDGIINYTTKKDEGSTFYFELPIVKPIIRDMTLVKQLEKVSHHNRLIVCDDDIDQLMLLKNLLESAGFKVDTAGSARETKALLSANQYDALLLDLILPDQDGISFIREIKSNPKLAKLPIIVISIIAQTGRSLINGGALTVMDWLEKPINLNKLLKTISTIESHLETEVPHILHIEDDIATQRAIFELLSDTAKITSVSSIKEAKELINNKFDLVILDLILPDGNGIEILPILSKYKIPVIIYSATELDGEFSKYVKQAFIKSKITPIDLVHKIREVLDKEVKHDNA